MKENITFNWFNWSHGAQLVAVLVYTDLKSSARVRNDVLLLF